MGSSPPLRAYKPTFNKNTRQAYGVITLPLRESRRANLLAMRRGGLEKLKQKNSKMAIS